MNNKIIGENIKKFRKGNYTQAQLAKKINRTESSVRKYEKGLVEIPIGVLEQIADVLNCTIKDLINGDDTLKAITMTEVFQNKDGSRYEKTTTRIELTDRAKFIDCYDNMNKIGQREALKRVSEMTELEKYTRKRDKPKLETVSDEELKQDYKYYPPDTPELNAAHADNYADAPEELKEREENMMDDEDF